MTVLQMVQSYLFCSFHCYSDFIMTLLKGLEDVTVWVCFELLNAVVICFLLVAFTLKSVEKFSAVKKIYTPDILILFRGIV